MVRYSTWNVITIHDFLYLPSCWQVTSYFKLLLSCFASAFSLFFSTFVVGVLGRKSMNLIPPLSCLQSATFSGMFGKSCITMQVLSHMIETFWCYFTCYELHQLLFRDLRPRFFDDVSPGQLHVHRTGDSDHGRFLHFWVLGQDTLQLCRHHLTEKHVRDCGGLIATFGNKIFSTVGIGFFNLGPVPIYKGTCDEKYFITLISCLTVLTLNIYL